MRVYYSEGLKTIETALTTEGIELSEYARDSILEVLSKIDNYEEEEVKILPKILLGKNMNSIFAQIPEHFKLVLGRDTKEAEQMPKMLKSLIPLCKNGWYVYIDIEDGGLTYGIFRKFRSPVALDFEQLIFDDKDRGVNNKESGMICMRPINGTSFVLRGLHFDDVVISFGFKDDKGQEEDRLFNMLIEDITTHVGGDKKYIKNALIHIVGAFKERVHGAIILFVNEEYLYPNDYLVGLKVEPHLNLLKCIEESKTVESYEAAERYYAITNLLYEFLNVDGITVVNCKGEIIGYNAFYRSEKTPMNVAGGARKRTFEGLKKQEDNSIIGVYYQSQDGNIQYVRREQV